MHLILETVTLFHLRLCFVMNFYQKLYKRTEILLRTREGKIEEVIREGRAQ